MKVYVSFFSPRFIDAHPHSWSLLLLAFCFFVSDFTPHHWQSGQKGASLILAGGSTWAVRLRAMGASLALGGHLWALSFFTRLWVPCALYPIPLFLAGSQILNCCSQRCCRFSNTRERNFVIFQCWEMIVLVDGKLPSIVKINFFLLW